MNDTVFSEARSDAVRSLLVEMVEVDTAPRQPRRHRGFVVAWIALGAAITIGAAGVVAANTGWTALPGANPSAPRSFAPIPSWPRNAHGQTYGKLGNSPVQPDLVEVVGIDKTGASVIGYVFSKQLTEAENNGGPPPTSPAQALKQQKAWQAKHPNGQKLPVYQNDGTTVVGVFTVGGP